MPATNYRDAAIRIVWRFFIDAAPFILFLLAFIAAQSLEAYLWPE